MQNKSTNWENAADVESCTVEYNCKVNTARFEHVKMVNSWKHSSEILKVIKK